MEPSFANKIIFNNVAKAYSNSKQCFFFITRYFPATQISRWVTLLTLAFANSAYAKTPLILIIYDKQVQIHQQVNKLLRNDAITPHSFHYQDISKQQITDNKADLIISIGNQAALSFPATSTPILQTLISENNLFQNTFCFQDNCPISLPPENIYTLFLDQPISRQINFLTLLLPNAKRIGSLNSLYSINKLKPLYAKAKKLGLTVNSRYIEENDLVNQNLNNLMPDIDVLFTFPDPVIHNKYNIPYLLLSTYRYNIPVIGFSKAYVNAGAIAAIHSTPEQIAQHIYELSNQIINAPQPLSNKQFFPKYFTISSNKNVARSMDLHLPDILSIKSKLLQLEE